MGQHVAGGSTVNEPREMAIPRRRLIQLLYFLVSHGETRGFQHHRGGFSIIGLSNSILLLSLDSGHGGDETSTPSLAQLHLQGIVFWTSLFALAFPLGFPPLPLSPFCLLFPLPFRSDPLHKTFVANSVFKAPNVTKSGLFQRNGWLQAHSTIQTFPCKHHVVPTLWAAFSSGKTGKMIPLLPSSSSKKPDNVKVASCRS